MNEYMNIKRKVRSLLNLFRSPRLIGLRRAGVMLDFYHEFNKPWLLEMGFGTILDIGANTGRYARTLSEVFPDAKLYAFEPIPTCFYELQHRMGGKNNFKGLNLALGNRTGQIDFFENKQSSASSVLPMMEAHKQAYPSTSLFSKVEVEIARLDDIVDTGIIEMRPSIFVKIDVQGYEMEVLLGGEHTIKQAKVIVIETSFAPLYHEQPLFSDIYSLLTDWGFTFAGTVFQHRDPNSGHILQIDSLFIK